MVTNNKKQIKLLLVDDEENIVNFIKMGLEEEGYTVYTAYNGIDAVERAIELKPHIIILDLMLPGIPGFEVCSRIKKSIKTSIIMLTALDDINDRVKGLELGADDYMVKPFSFKELLARINARMRNCFPELLDSVQVGDFHIDDAAHKLSYKENPVELSPTEYNLLRYLILNNGIVLSKAQILEKVWGFDFNGEDNIVEVYIRYLREKLGDKEHNLIKTVRGVGYKVVVK